jgi:hypothetical protein
MPNWIWWLIWPLLIVGSLGYLGFIGFELLQKANRAAKAFTPTVERLQSLSVALEKPPEIKPSEGNLFDDASVLAASHASNLKKRKAKRDAEQRRLINKLISYRPDESEFLP